MEVKAKPGNLRDVMPLAAKWVDEQRKAMGAAHVNGCIRRAVAGEPGLFYVLERVAPDLFRTLGTPSDMWDAGQYEVIGRLVVASAEYGLALYPFIAKPEHLMEKP